MLIKGKQGKESAHGIGIKQIKIFFLDALGNIYAPDAFCIAAADEDVVFCFGKKIISLHNNPSLTDRMFNRINIYRQISSTITRKITIASKAEMYMSFMIFLPLSPFLSQKYCIAPRKKNNAAAKKL